MHTHTVPANDRVTTPSRCHCGSRFGNQDHCPHCGCEQYERYCNASYPDRHADHWWCPGAETGTFRVPPVPVAPVPRDPFVETAGIDFTRPKRTRRRFGE